MHINFVESNNSDYIKWIYNPINDKIKTKYIILRNVANNKIIKIENETILYSNKPLNSLNNEQLKQILSQNKIKYYAHRLYSIRSIFLIYKFRYLLQLLYYD